MAEEERALVITGVGGNVDAWFRWQQGWIAETDWSQTYWWTFKLGETGDIITGRYGSQWFASRPLGTGQPVRSQEEPDKEACLVQFVRHLYDKKIGHISKRWDDADRTSIEYSRAKVKIGDVFEHFTTNAGVLQVPEWVCFRYAVEDYLENDPRIRFHPSRVREFIEENGLDRLEEME